MLQKFMNKPCTFAGINGAEVKLSEGVGQLCSFSDTQTTSSNPSWKGCPAGNEGGRAGAQGRGCCLLTALLQLIHTLTAPLSSITKSSDPWVLTSQHSHLDSQGNHLPG